MDFPRVTQPKLGGCTTHGLSHYPDYYRLPFPIPLSAEFIFLFHLAPAFHLWPHCYPDIHFHNQ